MRLRDRCILLLATTCGVAVSVAQPVTLVPSNFTSLRERWSWAEQQTASTDRSDGLWVGYSIERLMGENSWIGSFDRYDRRDRTTLFELLTGRAIEYNDEYQSGEDLRKTAERALDEMDGKRKPERKVMKDVALLFRFDAPPIRVEGLRSVRTSNITLHVDLERLPLVWLGKTSIEESVDLLKDLYAASSTDKVRKKLVGAIGLHGTHPKVFSFLKATATGDGETETRKDAIFWIGQQDTEEALELLMTLVKQESSKKLLEQTIFAISQISLERATDELISIGRESKNLEARKKAVFWLGQKASKKTMEMLRDVVYTDDNEEVQKQAVFALTQIHDGGVDEIIRIARKHPNPRIRKQAIFWLGQSDDPRAFDVIVDIAKGK